MRVKALPALLVCWLMAAELSFVAGQGSQSPSPSPCPKFYKRSKKTGECVDLNECKSNRFTQPICGANASCKNLIGAGYECKCDPGFETVGKVCIAIPASPAPVPIPSPRQQPSPAVTISSPAPARSPALPSPVLAAPSPKPSSGNADPTAICNACYDIHRACDASLASPCLRECVSSSWKVNPADPNGPCIDVNECDIPALKKLCTDQRLTCNNDEGSYACEPPCDNGWKWDEDLRECVDLDECKSPNVCKTNNRICVNRGMGLGFECSDLCVEGFWPDPSGKRPDPTVDIVPCIPGVDECAAGTAKCHPNAVCKSNLPDALGYTCTCKEGLLGDGVTNCEAPNPCARGKLGYDACLVGYTNAAYGQSSISTCTPVPPGTTGILGPGWKCTCGIKPVGQQSIDANAYDSAGNPIACVVVEITAYNCFPPDTMFWVQTPSGPVEKPIVDLVIGDKVACLDTADILRPTKPSWCPVAQWVHRMDYTTTLMAKLDFERLGGGGGSLSISGLHYQWFLEEGAGPGQVQYGAQLTSLDWGLKSYVTVPLDLKQARGQLMALALGSGSEVFSKGYEVVRVKEVTINTTSGGLMLFAAFSPFVIANNIVATTSVAAVGSRENLGGDANFFQFRQIFTAPWWSSIGMFEPLGTRSFDHEAGSVPTRAFRIKSESAVLNITASGVPFNLQAYVGWYLSRYQEWQANGQWISFDEVYNALLEYGSIPPASTRRRLA